ncbi:MAG: hypothetical protein WC340_07065 [Kiritimatiellia bacterium]
MTNYLTLLFAVTAISATALPVPDLSGYKQSNVRTAGENLLVNPGFETPVDVQPYNWRIHTGYAKHISDGGFKGTGGIVINKRDPERKGRITQILKNLKPKTRYIYGGKIKVLNSDGNKSAAFGVEGASTKYEYITGDCVWNDYSLEFVTPDCEDGAYHFIMFYADGGTGEAHFDDLYLYEANGTYYAGLLNPYNRIAGKDRTLIFTLSTIEEVRYEAVNPAALGAIAEVKDASDKTVFSDFQPVNENRFRVDGSKIKDGKYAMDVTILDTANRLIIGKVTNLVMYAGAPKVKRPARGAVEIDKYGRTIVDGKPFMPMGFLVGGMGRMYDIRYFADSPFNCVILYSGFSSYLREYKQKGAEGVLKQLDMLDQHGLKAIFGVPFLFPAPGFDEKNSRAQMKLWGCENDSYEEFIGKVADTVREHPAMLSWFLTDELSPARYRELISHRAVVNEHDPWHPTCGVFFQIREAAAYTATQDNPIIDYYPISGNGPQNQKLIVDSMNIAKKIWTHPDTGEMPFWAMLQMFNASGPNPSVAKNYHFPTETEMLSMSLMAAIHGSKAFLYYYYYDVLYGIGNTLDEKFERFAPLWKKICNMARELKDLEPFIMSIAPAPKVTVKDIKGETHARAFVDEQYGRIRILIASVGPGETEAEITVEDFKVPEFARDNVLRSKFAKTKRITDNTYLFKGVDVDSDILQRWPEYELDKDVNEEKKTL